MKILYINKCLNMFHAIRFVHAIAVFVIGWIIYRYLFQNDLLISLISIVCGFQFGILLHRRENGYSENRYKRDQMKVFAISSSCALLVLSYLLIHLLQDPMGQGIIINVFMCLLIGGTLPASVIYCGLYYLNYDAVEEYYKNRKQSSID